MIVENKAYSMEIDDSTGSIKSVHNGRKEFIFTGEKRPLFTIRFRDKDGGIIDLNAFHSLNTNIVISETDAEYEVKISYTTLGKYMVNALVTIRFPKNEAMTYWRIDIDNKTDWIIEWIDFPDVVVPNDLTAKGGTGKIVWPFNEGALIEDTSIRESFWFKYAEPNYPSRGFAGIYPAIICSQFMAYYEEWGGLYFGAHDVNGHVKCVEYFPVDEGIRLQFRFYPGGGEYKMDYDMVLGVFDGDWHDAAEIYRDWFLACNSNKMDPIHENSKLPEWYGESPVVITYPVRGKHDTDVMNPNKLFPYTNVLPIINNFAREFNSKIMALLMHWEGTAPWAPPYVWPPYGGEKALKDFADHLHESGHLLGVYCSGIGWTEQSNLIQEYSRKEQFEREHLEKYMCISPEGDLPYSNICTAQRRGYDLCPSQSFTVETMTKEITQMIDGGCDYIQALDQNHGGTSYFCYSKTHGHPPAPGKWQTDAMKEMYQRFQEISNQAGKKVLFGCESASAEPFIPNLLFSDARFNLNYFVGTPIPLYAYIYHEYVNNFMGNQVCTNFAFDNLKSPDNLLYRLAYSFHAGDMLTAVITENGEITWNWGIDWAKKLPEQESLLTFIRNANTWRTGVGKAYLHTGRMVKPFVIEGSPVQHFCMKDGRKFTAPYLLTSCWQAEDGSLGQIVVNYTKETVDFTVNLQKYNDREITLYEESDGSQFYHPLMDVNGYIGCHLRPLSCMLIHLK